MEIDFNLHFYKKRTAIFANNIESVRIIRNISFLVKKRTIYYHHLSGKLVNFLKNFKIYNYKNYIAEESVIIFDGINNFSHLSKIRNDIIKNHPDITVFVIFNVPNFIFVLNYFNNLIINRIKYSHRNKLKMIYIKLFKNSFYDFDSLKHWLIKNENKEWIIYFINSKITQSFNFIDNNNNNNNNNNILYHELFLNHIYDF